jgi:DNA polymerase-4
VGASISVGVARTKHLAKIASQVAKPDGLVVVDADTELDFFTACPSSSCGEWARSLRRGWLKLACLPLDSWRRRLGGRLERLLGPAAGEKLAALSWNRDTREIRMHRRARSAGAQSAIGKQPAEERVF